MTAASDCWVRVVDVAAAGRGGREGNTEGDEGEDGCEDDEEEPDPSSAYGGGSVVIVSVLVTTVILSGRTPIWGMAERAGEAGVEMMDSLASMVTLEPGVCTDVDARAETSFWPVFVDTATTSLVGLLKEDTCFAAVRALPTALTPAWVVSPTFLPYLCSAISTVLVATSPTTISAPSTTPSYTLAIAEAALRKNLPVAFSSSEGSLFFFTWYLWTSFTAIDPA